MSEHHSMTHAELMQRIGESRQASVLSQLRQILLCPWWSSTHRDAALELAVDSREEYRRKLRREADGICARLLQLDTMRANGMGCDPAGLHEIYNERTRLRARLRTIRATLRPRGM